MCDPVSASLVVAGLGASAVAKNNATNQQNRNMQAMQTAKEGQYQDGMNRQAGYTDEAQSAFAPVIANEGSGSFANQLANNTANRMQAFSANTLAAPNYVLADSTPANVRLYADKAFNREGAKTTRDQNNSAILGGYGDTQFNQGLDRNAYTRAFGNLSDKALHDVNLVGLDMSAAAHNTFKAPSPWLGFMGDAGQAATMYGAAGSPGAPKTVEGPRPNAAFVGPQPSKVKVLGGYF